jgi:hypothetical protein
MKLSVAEEHALREHLPGCAECQQRYQRHLLLARVDPAAPSAQDRLGAGLGFSAQPPKGRGIVWVVAAVAAMLLAVVVWRGVMPAGDSGFSPRGAGNGQGELWAERVSPGRSEKLASRMRADDELVFSYANPAGKKRLMVFAVDGKERVYWYFPAWSDAADDPAAVPIEGGAAPHALGEAVRHKLEPGALTVYGVFTDAPLTVKQIEQKLKGGPLELPGCEVKRMSIEVTP